MTTPHHPLASVNHTVVGLGVGAAPRLADSVMRA